MMLSQQTIPNSETLPSDAVAIEGGEGGGGLDDDIILAEEAAEEERQQQSSSTFSPHHSSAPTHINNEVETTATEGEHYFKLSPRHHDHNNLATTIEKPAGPNYCNNKRPRDSENFELELLLSSSPLAKKISESSTEVEDGYYLPSSLLKNKQKNDEDHTFFLNKNICEDELLQAKRMVNFCGGESETESTPQSSFQYCIQAPQLPPLIITHSTSTVEGLDEHNESSDDYKEEVPITLLEVEQDGEEKEISFNQTAPQILIQDSTDINQMDIIARPPADNTNPTTSLLAVEDNNEVMTTTMIRSNNAVQQQQSSTDNTLDNIASTPPQLLPESPSNLQTQTMMEEAENTEKLIVQTTTITLNEDSGVSDLDYSSLSTTQDVAQSSISSTTGRIEPVFTQRSNEIKTTVIELLNHVVDHHHQQQQQQSLPKPTATDNDIFLLDNNIDSTATNPTTMKELLLGPVLDSSQRKDDETSAVINDAVVSVSAANDDDDANNNDTSNENEPQQQQVPNSNITQAEPITRELNLSYSRKLPLATENHVADSIPERFEQAETKVPEINKECEDKVQPIAQPQLEIDEDPNIYPQEALETSVVIAEKGNKPSIETPVLPAAAAAAAAACHHHQDKLSSQENDGGQCEADGCHNTIFLLPSTKPIFDDVPKTVVNTPPNDIPIPIFKFKSITALMKPLQRNEPIVNIDKTQIIEQIVPRGENNRINAPPPLCDNHQVDDDILSNEPSPDDGNTNNNNSNDHPGISGGEISFDLEASKTIVTVDGTTHSTTENHHQMNFDFYDSGDVYGGNNEYNNDSAVINHKKPQDSQCPTSTDGGDQFIIQRRIQTPLFSDFVSKRFKNPASDTFQQRAASLSNQTPDLLNLHQTAAQNRAEGEEVQEEMLQKGDVRLAKKIDEDDVNMDIETQHATSSSIIISDSSNILSKHTKSSNNNMIFMSTHLLELKNQASVLQQQFETKLSKERIKVADAIMDRANITIEAERSAMHQELRKLKDDIITEATQEYQEKWQEATTTAQSQAQKNLNDKVEELRTDWRSRKLDTTKLIQEYSQNADATALLIALKAHWAEESEKLLQERESLCAKRFKDDLVLYREEIKKEIEAEQSEKVDRAITAARVDWDRTNLKF